jgi:HTH-type transcriptional regulator, competence development regulator
MRLVLDISSGAGYLDVVPRRAVALLPKLLKQARVTASLSLRAVEKSTGISNAYLSQLENGKTANPSPPVLAKLARAYSIPYADLMAAAGYLDTTLDTTSEPPPARRIAMLTNDLNADEQDQVEAFITYIRAQRTRATN